MRDKSVDRYICMYELSYPILPAEKMTGGSTRKKKRLLLNRIETPYTNLIIPPMRTPSSAATDDSWIQGDLPCVFLY